MNLLLDSHVLLWYDTSVRLSDAVRDRLDRADLHVSVVTIWELTYKRTLKKLPLPQSVTSIARKNRASLLSITPEHAELAGRLPLHHRDPFDRMLVAQAMIEDLTLVTHDRTLQQYGVPLLLA